MEKMNKYRLEREALENAFARRLLLDYNIKEVTTQRQAKNGTREFEFPVSSLSPKTRWGNVDPTIFPKLRLILDFFNVFFTHFNNELPSRGP